MKSQTARLALTSVLGALAVAVLVAVLPLWWPLDALTAGVQALGLIGAAIAGGGSVGAAAYGIRHIGSKAPTSAMLAQSPDGL